MMQNKIGEKQQFFGYENFKICEVTLKYNIFSLRRKTINK